MSVIVLSCGENTVYSPLSDHPYNRRFPLSDCLSGRRIFSHTKVPPLGDQSLPTSDYLKKGPIRRLEGEGQFSTILAAQTHSSGAQQCDSMASHQHKLNARQKKELCQAREEGPKLEYKDLVMIAEK